jgi:prepilin-type N-terminal cleavage/methylation domain-containing protein
VGQRPHGIRRNDSGFTLTELLIVIVILGVLTGIVVFAVGGFTNRGEVSACRTAMKTTETALEAYKAQNSGAAPAGALGTNAQILALVPTYLRTPPDTSTYTLTLDLAGNVVGTLANPQPATAGGKTTDCLLAKA